MTDRAKRVITRAKEEYGITLHWVEPGIRVFGITYPVAEAEAWLSGYAHGVDGPTGPATPWEWGR